MAVTSVQALTGNVSNTSGLGLGLSQQTPSLVFINTNDTYATVIGTGYLNNAAQLYGISFTKYQMAEVYTTDQGMLLMKIVVSTSGSVTNYSLALPYGETVNPVTYTGALVSGDLLKLNNTTGQVVDAGIAASNVMLLNSANTMTSGGSIVLLKANGTEAANAVTASGNAGIITTSSLTTVGGSSYAITWTNTLITSTSVIGLTLMGGTNTTKNITIQATAGSGTSTLTIYNNTAATALNGTILIGYTVF